MRQAKRRTKFSSENMKSDRLQVINFHNSRRSLCANDFDFSFSFCASSSLLAARANSMALIIILFSFHSLSPSNKFLFVFLSNKSRFAVKYLSLSLCVHLYTALDCCCFLFQFISTKKKLIN